MERRNFKINNYDLGFFPFDEPYKCQKDIMKTLLTAFEMKENCIIESPTGTGKCISSLSACVAYLNKYNLEQGSKREKELKNNYCDLLDIFKSLKIYRENLTMKLESVELNSLDIGKLECENSLKELNSLQETLNIKTELNEKLENFIYYNLLNSIFYKKNSNTKVSKDFESKIDYLFNVQIKELKSQIKQAISKFEHTGTVIYAVRTSSQMDVVAGELEKIPKFFKTSYLKSREFYCINTEFRDKFKGNLLNTNCKNNKKMCDSYKNYKKENKLANFDTNIENLNYYLENNVCPYYSEVKKCERADLIVCTYNYLLYKNCSNLYSSFISNPIIIIDEAHNIINACENKLNYIFKIEHFVKCILQLKKIEQRFRDTNEVPKIFKDFLFNKEQSISDLNNIGYILFEIMNNIIFLNQTYSHSTNDYRGITILQLFDFILTPLKDKNIFEIDQSKQENRKIILQKFNFKTTLINFVNLKEILKKIEDISQVSQKRFETEIDYLDNIGKFIKNIFKLIENAINHKENIFLDDYFFLCNRFYSNKISDFEMKNYHKEYLNSYSNNISSLTFFGKHLLFYEKIQSKEMKLICMTPKILFSKINKFKPSSICLISGTVQPFQFYEYELNIKFKNQLTSSHIIDSKNVNFISCQNPLMKKSKNLKEMKFTYQTMSNENLKLILFRESIDIILNIIKSGSVGNIIYMKSFNALYDLKNFLSKYFCENQNFTLTQSHAGNCFKLFVKDIKMDLSFYFDSNYSKKSKQDIIAEYKKEVSLGNKSCLFTVMRGSLSEGVNFTNNETSALFILGIPYLDLNDDMVRLKQIYLNEKFKSGQHCLDGEDWYYLQSMIAFNQTVGRAIRSKTDYATICVIDSHLKKKKIKTNLSKWILNLKKEKLTDKNHEEVYHRTKEFYKFYSNN